MSIKKSVIFLAAFALSVFCLGMLPACGPVDPADIPFGGVSGNGLYASYDDGDVKFTLAERGKYDVYKSASPDTAFTKVDDFNGQTYRTGDAESYFLFKKAGKSETAAGPFSYIRSTFGANTKVFMPSDDQAGIQDFIDTFYATSVWHEYAKTRLEMLFMPGEYDEIDMHVGFYTSVAGLGYVPSSVSLKALHTFHKPLSESSTTNFWRTVENLTLEENSLWSVSQATSLRRVHAKGNLELMGHGWASGGFISDSQIDGGVYAKVQQQWFTRNSQVGLWDGVDINMVFAGVTGELPGEWSASNRTTKLETTETIREKPFLVFDESKGYGVFLPALRHDASGHSWQDGATDGKFIGIDDFYIAFPEKDNAASINKALDQGKHILLTPGIYNVERPITIKNANTVFMGMGLATLQTLDVNTDTAMRISDVSGVNVSSLLIDSGLVTESLIEIGEEGADARHTDNPICLADMFFRSGGGRMFQYESTEINRTMIINDVLGDNFWLWRADHSSYAPDDMHFAWDDDWNWQPGTDKMTSWDWEYINAYDAEGNQRWENLGAGGLQRNKGRVGVEINGDYVSLYGLMVEHYTEYQTVWNGEYGFMCFYQSETPYEVPQQSDWMSHNGTVQGYASYKVADHVQNHTAHGIGVYYVNNTNQGVVILDHGIEAPANPGIALHHMALARFAGSAAAGSGIRHVVNDQGPGVYNSGQKTSFTSFIGGVYTP